MVCPTQLTWSLHTYYSLPAQDGFAPLHIYAARGDINALKKCLKQENLHIDVRDSFAVDENKVSLQLNRI
jgi:hypothetical protein